MSIEIIQDLIPAGSLGSASPLIRMDGVTIHDSGSRQPGTNARWLARYLKSADARKREASWHFAVDDHEIIQSIPIEKEAWHCGNSRGNQATLSIEICVNSDGDIVAATSKAAELCAYLLRDAGLPVEGHVFQHHDWSRKNCPEQLRAGNPYPWDEFLSLVNDYYNMEE